MSGPKVVRIRTREERIAECLTLIDRLQASIEQLEALERRHDRTRPDFSRNRIRLLDDLNAKVTAGSFDEVQRVAQTERDTVVFEREELERAIVEKAVSLASRKCRIQQLADGLSQRARAEGRPPPASLNTIPNLLSTDEGIETAEHAVSQMLSEYIEASTRGSNRALSQTQRQLASALSSGESIESLADWAARRAAESAGNLLGQLERVIAELTALDPSESGAQFLARARRIKSEPDPQLQARQIDSLLLEWPAQRRKLKEHAAASSKARELLLILSREPQEQAAKAIAARLIATLSQGTVRLTASITEAERYLTAAARSKAAQARRDAVLRGLRTLGYEIGGNLNTAAPKAGRVLVRKPASQGYGVELMIPEGAERMQVKVVAISGERARDRASDHKAETAWCSEFTNLQATLKKEGTDLAIEHALGVGVAEIAEVSIDNDVDLSRLSAADLKRPQ